MPSRQWFAIIALGRDRPGIVADLSECVFGCGYNLEDASMTTLGNEFAVLMLVSGLDDPPYSALHDAAKRLEWEKRLTVFVRPLDGPPQSHPTHPSASYLITAVGVDRAGIVAGVSRCLAEHGIGIEDLRGAVSAAPQSGTPVYTLTIRADIPRSVDAGALTSALEKVGQRLDVEVSVSELVEA